MPAVSEKQRRAMWAAANGKSNLGIPKSVGKEFVEKKDAIHDYMDAACKGDSNSMKEAMKKAMKK